MEYTKEWKRKIVEEAKKRDSDDDSVRPLKWPTYESMMELWGECK